MAELTGNYAGLDSILRKLLYQVMNKEQFSLSGTKSIYFERVTKTMIKKNILYRDFVYDLDGVQKKSRFMLVKLPEDAKKPNIQATFTMHFIQEVDIPITEEERNIYLESQKIKVLPNTSMFAER